MLKNNGISFIKRSYTMSDFKSSLNDYGNSLNKYGDSLSDYRKSLGNLDTNLNYLSMNYSLLYDALSDLEYHTHNIISIDKHIIKIINVSQHYNDLILKENQKTNNNLQHVDSCLCKLQSLL